MGFTIKQDGSTISARFEGLLTFHDQEAGDELIAEIDTLLGSEAIRLVAFDLSAVEALDSHWLGVFIRVLRKVREAKAEMEMHKPSKDVLRLFQIVELDRVLRIIS